MPVPLAEALLSWYADQGRDLPWRRSQDPYAVWISEVMCQQTRVATVIPYYIRWMERFPTVDALASARVDEVLALWEGLGYYRRAHNLHRAAKTLVAEYGGALPRTVRELVGLPGVGRYTAAAIAAIAHDADAVALDGNLRRVLSRLFDLELDPRSSEGRRQLLARASEILPAGRASDFNQALMDLGATLCTPKAPACGSCPVATYCVALARGVQEDRPRRAPRRAIPHRTAVAGVLRQHGAVLISRRPEGKLLGGLWAFPGGEQEPGESLPTCLQRVLRRDIGVEVTVEAEVGIFHHSYTHFRLTVHAFACHLLAGQPDCRQHTALRWAEGARLGAFPMGKIDRDIAAAIVSQDAGSTSSSPERSPGRAGI